MDNHIVNVMLPTLSRDFHEPIASLQWTRLGYIISLAVCVPVSGWLGDRFGTKRIFILAVLLFTGASGACGQSHSVAELVIFRIIQGAGGGLLTPVGTAMLYRSYPPEERARMTRLLLVPTLLGPVLAQPIGGLLVTKASWRWAFYLNVPAGTVALIVSALYILEHREPGTRQLDLRGFVLAGLRTGNVPLFSQPRSKTKGWSSPDVVATGLVGLSALTAFVLVEQHQEHPMLKLSLLARDRLFRATNIVTNVNTVAFSGLLFLGPIFLQEAKRQTALDAGLTTFCVALGSMTASQTVARLYPYIGPRRLAGLSSMAFAFALAAFSLSESPRISGGVGSCSFSRDCQMVATQWQSRVPCLQWSLPRKRVVVRR